MISFINSLAFLQDFIQPEEIAGLKDFFDKQVLKFEGLVNMPDDFGSSADRLARWPSFYWVTVWRHLIIK